MSVILKFNKNLVKKLTEHVDKNMDDAANHLKNKIEDNLSGRSGFPQPKTGKLRDSISVDAEKFDKRIKTDVEYAKFLEFGTRKMAAKPFMRPTYKQELDKIKQNLGKKFKWII